MSVREKNGKWVVDCYTKDLKRVRQEFKTKEEAQAAERRLRGS